MAINPSGMVMRLNPVQSLDLTGFARAKEHQDDLRMRREQLRMQREQFEEQKRRNADDLRLREEAEAGERARATLEAEQKKAAGEAAAAAALDEKRFALQQKFGETAGSGDYEGAESYAPLMANLGSGLDITRRDNGMPVYRLHHDAKADAAQEAAEYGRNWEKAERPLDRDALGENPDAGLAAAPAIAPATPTGTVLDMEALHNQRNARLGPAMEALVAAHPYDYQDSAASTAKGIAAMPMAGPKAMEEFRHQRSGPNDLIKAQLENDAQRGAKGEVTEVQKMQFRKAGAGFADKAYTQQGIKASMGTIDVADRLVAALESDDPYITQQAGQLLLQLGKVKGAASDKELGMVIGDDKASVFEQASNWLETKIRGNFPVAQRNALIAWAKKQKSTEQQVFNSYVDSLDRTAASKSNQYEREGLLEYRNALPRRLLNQYDEWRSSQGPRRDPGAPTGAAPTGGGKTAAREDIEDELLLQAADAGFDGESLMHLMGAESQGDPTVKNQKGSSAQGLFQFTDETAKAYGLKNAAEYAALPPEDQIRLGLERFKKIGLDADSTPDDFALANAAPKYIGKSDDTQVTEYKSGTKFGDDVRAKNPGWIPADGGEITVGSILDFYRRKRGGGGGKLGVTSVGGPAPTGSKSDRIRALAEKAKQ